MTDESKNPPATEWIVHCNRHGTRAHLQLEGLEKNPPDLKHCSLRAGEMPPKCSQRCLETLTFLCPGSDEDTHCSEPI